MGYIVRAEKRVNRVHLGAVLGGCLGNEEGVLYVLTSKRCRIPSTPLA